MYKFKNLQCTQVVVRSGVLHTCLGTFDRSIQTFLFDLEMKTSELIANGVSGVLIGSANTRRTCVPSYLILEHVHLTSCFDFDLLGEQDSVRG